jgi:hypothetical protein
MEKIKYDCEHGVDYNGVFIICEFNDKACSFMDNQLECEICKEEYEECI